MISAQEKYIDHPLFAHCIEITVPPGHYSLIDDLVEWIDEYNVKNKTLIGFAQIKLKFNMLTIYVEHYAKQNNEKWRDGQKTLGWPEYYKIRTVQSHIADVCEKSRKICKVCGKNKTEMVVDNEIKFVCFDHVHNENSWWRKND